MTKRLCAVGLCVAAALACASAAAADAPPEPQAGQGEDATALRERGNTAMRSGRPADALEAYEHVYALTHDVAMLYNMARAHQALTNYARAEDLLRQFKHEASPEMLDKVKGLDRLLDEVAARVHTLTVHAAEAGAEIRLGGRVVGTTPLAAPLRLNAGAMEIDVRAEGFLPFRQSLELRGGVASTIEVTFVRVDNSGVVLVRSPQAGASVEIDGRPAGNVPLEVPLAAGAHEIRLTKDGFTPSRSKVVIVAGQRKDVEIDLAGTPSILSRWWFWTAVGVVIAGGAASFVALTTEKPPPSGSIPPGQISLGLRY